jgi:hypothetical protein
MAMLGRALLAAALLSPVWAGQVFAGDDEQGQIVRLGELNVGSLSIAGSGNSISLYQEMPAGAHVGNTALVRIRGDGNGAGLGGGSLFTGLGIDAPLTSGRLAQIGTDNRLDLSVSGNGNQFAFLQNGVGNVLRGAITGSANQVAAMQLGAGNVLHFSQVGSGNMLSVTQISR